MTVTPITDNPLIRELYELPVPVLTAYLHSPAPGPGVDDTELRIRALLDDLRPAHPTPDAMRAMGSVLGTLETGTPPAAAFVGADGQTRLFRLPGADADLPDQAHASAVPHVLPLLAWRQQHPAFVLVMLDRAGAELVVQPAGAAPAMRTAIAGPDDEIERNAPGGMAQGRYQNRAEDSWQHNAGRAAEAVTAALTDARADLLIVGGDVRARQYFLDQLPAHVHTRVTIKTIAGSRSADGSEHRRAEQIEAAVRAHTAEESRQALDRVHERSGPGGLAVEGPAATIHALARAQVQTLLLDPEVDTEPTTAWFGPAPTDISEHRSGVLVPDGRPCHGPFPEVLARAAVLTDADIRLLPPDMEDAPPHGVGALCRYSVS